MAKNKVDAMWEDLKGKGYFQSDKATFDKYFYAPGAQGYKNRKALYDDLHKKGYLQSPTYEDFARKIGLQAVNGGSKAATRGTGLSQFPADVEERRMRTAATPTPFNKSKARRALQQQQQAIESQQKRWQKQADRLRQYDEKRSGTLPGGMERMEERAGEYLATGEAAPVPVAPNPEVVRGDMIMGNDGRMQQSYQVGSDLYSSRAGAEAELYRESHPMEDDLASTDTEIEDLDRRIAERTAQLQGGDYGFAAGLANAESGSGAPIFNQALLNDPELSMLWTAKRAAEDKRKMIRRDLDGDGFFGVLGNELFSLDTWDFGAQELSDAANLMIYGDAKFDDSKLDDAQKSMMSNAYAKQVAQQMYGENDTFWQRAGSITAQAIPFVSQFLATGGMGDVLQGGAKLTSKLAARTAANKVLGNRVAQWVIRNAGVAADDMLAAFVMSNTVGGMTTAADVVGRHQGQMVMGPDGTYRFEGGKSWGRAIYEGEVANTLEYYTEMLGNHFGYLSNLAGRGMASAAETGVGRWLAQGADKIGIGKLSQFFNRVKGSEWMAATNHMLRSGGFHDYPSEVLEEEVNIVLNSLLVGDNKFSDLVDGKTQLDIVGGMLLSVGFMQSPGIVGGSAQAAQYYRYKHATDVADQTARARLGDEKWDALKSGLDEAKNEEIMDILGVVLADESLPTFGKTAVVNYVSNLLKMRGYNLRTMADAKDKIDNPEPADDQQADTNAAFHEGYNAPNEQQNAIGERMNESVQRLVSMGYSGEDLGRLDRGEYDVAFLNSLPDDQRIAVLDYLNAKAALDGTVQHSQDEIENAVAQSDAQVDARTNTASGEVITATLKDGRQVAITRGNVATVDNMQEGTIEVDNDASDGDLVARDEQTGEVVMIHVTDIQQVDGVVNPEELKQEAADNIRQTMAQEIAARINGDIQAGGSYDMMDEQGNTMHGTVLELNPDNTAVVQMDGAPQPMVLPTQNVQTWVDNAKARMSMAPAQQQTQQPLQSNGPQDNAATQVTPVQAAPAAPVQAPVQSTDTENQPADLPMDEKTGEPVWNQTTPEQGYSHLAQSGLNADDITSLIDDRLAQADAAIAKASKGGTIDDRLAARQAKNYWEAVKAMHDAAIANQVAAETQQPATDTAAEPQSTEQDAPAATEEPSQSADTENQAGTIRPEVGRDVAGDTGVLDEDRAVLEGEMSGKTLDMINKIAKQLGLKIRVYNDENATGENGFFDPQTKTIWVNMGRRTGRLAAWVLGHEMTHAMDAKARGKHSKAYRDFKRIAVSFVRSVEGVQAYEARIARTMQLYKDNPDVDASLVTRDYIEDEVACDIAGELLAEGPEFMERLFRDATDRNAIQRVCDAIMDFIDRMLSILNANSDEYRAMSLLRDAMNNLYNDVKIQGDIAENLEPAADAEVETDIQDEAAADRKGKRKSITANAEGAGLQASETVKETWRVPQEDGTYKEEERWVKKPLLDEQGNVVFRMGDKEFNGNNPISVEDLEENPNTVLNYMLNDAVNIGKLSEKKARQIRQKYADMLNAYLRRGMTDENGTGFENLENSWMWVGETAYKTVASNSDEQYSYSLDITRVCKKNEAVIRAISALQMKTGYGVTPGQIMDIYMTTDAEGYQVPCPVCYVFSRYINNGKYATAIVNGMQKYGKYLPGQAEAKDRDWWVAKMKEETARAKKLESSIKKANEDVKTILDNIDALSREITSGTLSEEEQAAKMQELKDMDERYRAALDVISQEAMPRWIKSFVLEGSEQSGWRMREDAAMPEDMEDFISHALDIRKTASAMVKYPAITRYRRAGGSAGGKEITFASNNDMGSIAMALGISKSNLDNFNNYYLQAMEAGSEEERAALLKKAQNRFGDARLYAQRQTLRGGQRMWSWSDNIEALASDVASNLMQLEMLGGALQTYSKQLEGVRLVAAMNGYVNASLMGYGDGVMEVTEDNITTDENGQRVLANDITNADNKGRERIIANAGSPIYRNEDGKDYVLVFDDVVGIDPFGHKGKDGKFRRGLFALNEEYDHAGNILVGMNDIHVRAAMADPRVFFIIPWHASGMSNHILMQMFRVLGVDTEGFKATDYTKMQEEVNFLETTDKGKLKHTVSKDVEAFWNNHTYEGEFKSGIGHIANGNHKGGLSKQQLYYRELRDAIFDGTAKDDKKMMRDIMNDEFLSQVYRQVTTRVDDGKMTEKDKEFIYPYEYWDETSTVDNADINGKRYLEYCRRMGFKPKFTGKYEKKTGELSNDGNFADDPGYWKLLIDRRMYDRDGNYQGLTSVDSSNLEPSMYDPKETQKEFNVTEVATNEGAEKIAEKVYQRETERTGTMPTPNLAMTMEEAVTQYNDVTARQAARIKAENDAKKAAEAARVKAEKAAERARKKAERDAEKARLKAEREAAKRTAKGVRKSLSTEIAAKYPNWMDNQVVEDKGENKKRGQNTQIAGTVSTYKKVGDWVEKNLGKGVRVLDASSGLGLGTLELRGRGFNIDDIEPYPGKGRDQQPTYGGVDAYQRAMDDGKEYDYIISNAVLNVIPDDWRAGVLHDMATLLAPGGKMFINTRKSGEEKNIKNKIELESPQEVLVGTPDNITSYQRFFTPKELKGYVERELGDGYTVEVANEANSGTKGLAAVVVTKNGEHPDGPQGGIRFSLIGEQGTGRLDALDEGSRIQDRDVAEEMERTGKDAKTIKLATGWERGADNKWRYEIMDKGIKDEFPNNPDELIDSTTYPLSSIIDNEELFSAYPELKTATVEIRFDMNPRIAGSAAENHIDLNADHINVKVFGTTLKKYWPKAKELEISWNHFKKYHDEIVNNGGIPQFDFIISASTKRTLAHEVQHLIQRMEGFARGTNSGNPNYRKTAGEVEARNVEKRYGMSEEKRRGSLAEETEDVPRSEQIVRFSLSDEDYSQAVESGDQKKVAKMVRDAVKAAMPNTKAVDRWGKPRLLYHGTPQENQFYEFNGTIYLSSNRSVAGEYTHYRRTFGANPRQTGRIMPVFVNLENPLEIDANRHLWRNIDVDWSDTPVTTRDIEEYAKQNGYDGVIIKRVRDNMYDNDTTAADVYIAFSPEQVKSAGPTYEQKKRSHFPWDDYSELAGEIGATYDNDGNLIPLSERFNLENPDIRFSLSEDTQKIFDTAKRKFGETKDIREAGYVLPDGTMLDFSGRHEMDPGSDSSHLAGSRHTDHRAINQIDFVYDENGDEVDTGVKSDMPDFIKRGAIRIDASNGLINLSVKPTAEQRKVLRQLVAENGGTVDVDFGDGWDTDHSVYYDNTKPAKVLGDIDRYFDEGIKPQSNARFSLADTFYSNAAKAVEGVKQEKAKAEQWKAMLTKAGGIKAGEDKWMGLSTWLDEHKGETLTKDEVRRFVAENGIEMEEVNYGDEWYLNAVRRPETQARLKDIQDKHRQYLDEAKKKHGDTWMAYVEAGERLDEDYPGSFEAFETYGDEGKLRIKPGSHMEALDVLGVGHDQPINETRSRYTTPGLENNREIAFVVPGVEPYQEHDETHFGPENQGRAVMWVRFGEARDADGKRVLVIDEIQSNRHQDAREKGYKETSARRMAERYRQRLKEKYPNGFAVNQDESNRRNVPMLSKEELERLYELREAERTEIETRNNNGIPAAPFEKNWHEVAMKRMLRLAAEEGFDKVAWTTGEQQAERYGLGNVVREIEVQPYPESRARRIYLKTPTGEEITMHTDENGIIEVGRFGGYRLEEVVGKELAKKIESVTEDTAINGDGMRVGGEGMKGFYDQMLPSFMNKYGKRWGVKVGEVTLDTPGRETMHSVDINEDMKQSVMQGQPLFSLGDGSPRDVAIASGVYERMLRRGGFQFQEAMQDSMLSLKRLYQAVLGRKTRIEDVPDNENAYLAENAMSSINAAEQHEYFTKLMKPLLAAVYNLAGKDTKKRQQLIDYMMAKHGLERNLVLADRDAQETAANGGDYQQAYAENREKDYSGLTALTGESDVAAAEAIAQQMVDDYERDHDTTELWSRVKAATGSTLYKMYSSGLMSKATYDKTVQMFEYYIPLRGWDETTSDEVYGYLTDKSGPLGSPIKHAEGRSSKADDPIATIALMADDTIRAGNRNLMKQKFLIFAQNHPSDLVSVNRLWLQYNEATDEWEPVFADIEADDTPEEVAQKVEAFEARMEQLAANDPDKYKRGRDAVNIPFKVVKNNLAEHQILVKRGGETYVLTINGNPRAAQALNGMTNPDVKIDKGVISFLYNTAQSVNRELSAFYTTRNPDFIMSNFLRDTLYSNCMTWVKESPNYALKFHKNFGKFNPAMLFRLFQKWENGTLDMNNRTEAMFYQFMSNGGETGYTNVKDVEGHKRTIAKELRRQSNAIRKGWHLLGEEFDVLNRAVENCARFAAFVTSREMGRSIGRSVYDAKEVSVNFNKKGAGDKLGSAVGENIWGKIGSGISGAGRTFWIFWNAGVQGMTNFGRAFKRHPAKAIAGAASMYMLGTATALLAQAMGGDDEDDKDYYYNLPENVRRSNICFRLGSKLPWITIPLPIEFRAIYGLGEMAVGVITGKERYSDSELAYNIISQVSQILPLDLTEGEGGWENLMPTVGKTWSELAKNKTWYGMPIYKDTPFNKDMPQWTKAYSSANQYIVSFTRWLNEITGGNDYKKGKLDWNPAKIEYALKSYLGGITTTVDHLVKSFDAATGRGEFNWRDVPLASRVLRHGDERTAFRKAKNEYFNFKAEAEETKRLLNDYQKDTTNPVKYAELLNMMHYSPEYGRYLVFEAYNERIEDIRKAIKDGTAPADAEQMENEAIRDLVDAMHGYDNSALGKGLAKGDKNALEKAYDNDSTMREIVGKELAKRAGLDNDKFNKEPAWNATERTKRTHETYERIRNNFDRAEDVVLESEQKKAREAEDKERYDAIKSIQTELNKIRTGKDATSKRGEVIGLGQGDDERIMNELRAARKQAIADLRNEGPEKALENLKARTKRLGLRVKD